jgi:RNA polymerase sigma-70 factor (ECF subfamily)
LHDADELARFELAILPHLDAAYNLARWLTRRDQDAEDVVQEASLRAFQFFDSFHGTNGRAWFLAIVRNTCYTWMKANQAPAPAVPWDDTIQAPAPLALDPLRTVVQRENQHLVRQAVEELPAEYREVIVLRELEGFSYKEIAQIAAIPIGTVMSRLARARERLQQLLAPRLEKDM